MSYVLSFFMLALAIAIFARERGTSLEQVNDWLLLEILAPLLPVAVLVVAVVGTWAVYRLGLAIWQRRQATRAR
jgi:hypothetical protein